MCAAERDFGEEEAVKDQRCKRLFAKRVEAGRAGNGASRSLNEQRAKQAAGLI